MSTCVLKAIFVVSVPILPCLIPIFGKRKPFLYFLFKVGWLEQKIWEILCKPWAMVLNGFSGKEPVRKSKMFVFLRCLWTVIRFQKHYSTRKGKHIDTRDPYITGVKSKKDRLVKNPKKNFPFSLKASAISSTLLLLSMCFEMYMSASSKQDFHYISYLPFPVNLINVNRVEIYIRIR